MKVRLEIAKTKPGVDGVSLWGRWNQAVWDNQGRHTLLVKEGIAEEQSVEGRSFTAREVVEKTSMGGGLERAYDGREAKT